MSVFLSRLVLDLHSRAVRRDLADIQQLHRTVMRQFDPEAGNRGSQRVLFRLELPRSGAPILIVQSGAPPKWEIESDYVLRPPEMKDIAEALDAIAPGQRLRFRLRANPTRRPLAPERANAPRVPLTNWNDRLAWLDRKLERIAVLDSLDIASLPRETGRAGAHRITIWPVLFEGGLDAIDAQRLRAAIISGIGPARAFGNGLLSVAPQ